MYAIGAVVGLIGGIKVYSKFSSGDPDTTSKTAASWFGACIFLIVAATIPPFLLPLIPVVMEYSINKGIGETVEYKRA